MAENLRSMLTRSWRQLRAWFSLNDLVFIAAAGFLGYGIWLIHQPSAYITIGLLFVLLTTWGRFKS